MGPGYYLVLALFAAGPTLPTPMGETPLDWPTILAYSRATGTVIEAWEMQALRDMSRAYMAGQKRGTDVLSKPPIPIG